MKFLVKIETSSIYDKKLEINQELIDKIVKAGNERSQLDKIDSIPIASFAAILKGEKTEYDSLLMSDYQSWASFIIDKVGKEAVYFGELVDWGESYFEIIKAEVVKDD